MSYGTFSDHLAVSNAVKEWLQKPYFRHMTYAMANGLNNNDLKIIRNSRMQLMQALESAGFLWRTKHDDLEVCVLSCTFTAAVRHRAVQHGIGLYTVQQTANMWSRITRSNLASDKYSELVPLHVDCR